MPAARGDAHVFDVIEKPDGAVGEENVSGPLPVFASVSVWGALLLPTTCGPKFKTDGVNVATGIKTPLPAKFTVKDCPPGASVLIVSIPVR